jgi:hypothetical protein
MRSMMLRRMRMAHILASVAGALAFGSSVLSAQSNSAATVTGIVFDSLFTQRALGGAQVWLEGTDRTAITDAEGRFRFQTIAPGRYTVTVLHAALDSIGVAAPSREIDVTAGATIDVSLGTPSDRTVLSVLCAAQPMDSATGLMVGSVSERGTGRVVEGATILATWSLWTLNKGLKQELRNASATADASGTFRLCGVPTDVPVQLRTVSLGGSAAVMETSLEGQAVAMRSLLLDPARAESDSTASPAIGRSRASLTATVRTMSGRPIRGVQTSVIGVPDGALSNDSGVVAMTNLPTGTQVIEFRAIGYRPLRTRLALSARGSNRVDVTLDDRITELSPLTVSALRRPRITNEFEERRKSGRGVFFDEAYIAKRRSLGVNDIFYGVPGVKVSLSGYSSVVTIMRSGGMADNMVDGCSPTYFVDGIRISTDDGMFSIDNIIRPQDIVGMELYRSLAEAPPQYQQSGSGCGLILIWTKRGKR